MSPINTNTRVMRPTPEIRAEVAQGRIPMPAARPFPVGPVPGRHRSIEERPTEQIDAAKVAELRAEPVRVIRPLPAPKSSSSVRVWLATLSAQLRGLVVSVKRRFGRG